MKKLILSLILLIVVGFMVIPAHADQLNEELSITGFAQFDYRGDKPGNDDVFVDRIRLIGEWIPDEEFMVKVQGDYRYFTKSVRLTESFVLFTPGTLPGWKFQAGRIFVMTGAVFPPPQGNPFIGYPAMNKEYCDITGASATWNNASTTCQLALVNEEDKFDGRYDDLAISVSRKLGNGVSLSASGIRSDSQRLWTSYLAFPVGKDCEGKIVFNSDDLANRRGRYVELVWAKNQWEVAGSYGYESSSDANDEGRLAVSRIFEEGKFPMELTLQINFSKEKPSVWIQFQTPIAYPKSKK